MKKIIWRCAAVLVALALIIGCVIVALGNGEQQTRKKIEITLKVENGEKSTAYKFETDCIYLMDAILSNDFAEGEMREEGFWITRVADIEAAENDHWQIYIGTEMTAKKADKIKLEDGKQYILKFITEGEDVENKGSAG